MRRNSYHSEEIQVGDDVLRIITGDGLPRATLQYLYHDGLYLADLHFWVIKELADFWNRVAHLYDIDE